MVRPAETYPTLSLAERDRRWELTRKFIEEQGLDCLVIAGVNDRHNLDRYITNWVSGWVIFPKAGEPILITPVNSALIYDMERRATGESTSWVTQMRYGGERDVVKVLKGSGYERSKIGVVGLSLGSGRGWIFYQTWTNVLEGLPDANFIDVTLPFSVLIGVKSEEELEMIKKAADVAELAAEEMLRVVKPGVRESDVVTALMAVIHGHGCTGSGAAFGPIILGSGPNNVCAQTPLWMSIGGEPRMLASGDLVHTEIFVNYAGFLAQTQVSISIGPPDERLRRGEDLARASYDEGLKALVSGTQYSDVIRAMSRPQEEAGAAQAGVLIHSLNTLFFSSPANIRLDKVPGMERYFAGGLPEVARGADKDFVIRAGMVFEVEPKALVGGRQTWLGSTVVVTEQEPVELNKIGTHLVTI